MTICETKLCKRCASGSANNRTSSVEPVNWKPAQLVFRGHSKCNTIFTRIQSIFICSIRWFRRIFLGDLRPRMQVQLGGNEEQTGNVPNYQISGSGILHWLGPDEAWTTVRSASRVSVFRLRNLHTKFWFLPSASVCYGSVQLGKSLGKQHEAVRTVLLSIIALRPYRRSGKRVTSASRGKRVGNSKMLTGPYNEIAHRN